MHNPNVQQLLKERSEALAEPSMEVYAEALHATKRQAFLTKQGTVTYSEPEPFWKVRMEAAARVLKYIGQAPPAEDHGSQVDAAENEGDPELENKVETLSSSDKTLIGRAAQIDEKLAEVERQLSEDDSHGPEQPDET